MPSPYESNPGEYCTGVCIIYLVIWLPAAIITYFIMEKREGNAFAWALVVFAFGLIGTVVFLIYLIGTRDEDRRRGSYIPGSGVYGGRQGQMLQQPQAQMKKVEADPYFRDYELDDLLEEGKLGEARKYLKDMLQMAKEMGDEKGYQNFKTYEAKINKIATDPMRGKRN